MANLFTQIIRAIANRNDGFMPYYFSQWIDAKPMFNDYSGELAKLQAILTNPAVLKVMMLQADLFCQGEFYVYKKEKERETDPILDLLKRPNQMQSQTQWLKDYVMWRMTGTAYLYIDESMPESGNNMYWLNPINIEWPTSFNSEQGKLVLSKATKSKLEKTIVKYKLEDNTRLSIPLSKVLVFTDISNGTGNWYKGHSRLDALYKIISNSEHSLDAKNINVRYSGKFIVSGQNKEMDVTKQMMSSEEKNDIESKVDKGKAVQAVQTPISISRYVSDLGNLKLDEAFLADYFLIGTMFNIPRDVLEAYQSSTYENQEKARASHVSYSLQAWGNDLCEGVAGYFKYNEKKLHLCLSWEHLPFNQVFEKEKQIVLAQKINTFTRMLNLGIPLDEINKYLDLKFTIDEAARAATQANNSGQSGNNQAGNQRQ